MVLTHRAGSLASFKARRTPPAPPGATGRGLSIEFSKIGHSGSLRRRGGPTEVVQPRRCARRRRPISVSSIWKRIKNEPAAQITVGDPVVLRWAAGNDLSAGLDGHQVGKATAS